MTTKLKSRPPLHHSVEIAEEPVAPAARINTEFGPEFASAPKGIYNTKHQPLKLGDKIGGGGEGTVYNIHDQPEFVAKLYHEPPSPEKAAKLIALAGRGAERLSKMSAWPVDVLRDRPDGNVIGFVMRKIQQAEEVHTLHSPKSRLKKFPEASWAFLLHVATNIARAIATMHEHGFVVGDVNPKNILVTRQATVFLLDCDSFQFVDNGKTWRCEGGFPEYTPPELQGIPFSDIDRTQEHDCFGLAVVIFQLLFLGRHPYSGRFLGVGEMPLEQAIHEGRFAYGTDAATRNMQPPPGTLPFEALPASLTALLRRAFLERDRPNPREWIAPLEQFSQSLQRCKLHNGHLYFAELPDCPWCELEGRAGLRLFNFQLQAGQSTGPFHLHNILNELHHLEQVKSLPAASPVAAMPSLAATQYAQYRDVRFWLAMGVAMFAGGLTSWLTDFPVALWLLVGAGFLARKIAKSNPERPLLFPSLRAGASTPTLAEQTKERKQAAHRQLKRLEHQLWGDKEGERGYFKRLKEIKGRLREYQSVSERRAQRCQTALEGLQKRALAKHLKQYSFDDPRLAALTPEMKTWLHERGIMTAADLTSHRFKPSGDASQFQLLLNWRQQLVDSFQPPQSLPPETRVAIERELDKWKLRLETEVNNAIASLRALRVRQEERRSQLMQPWDQTQRDLAQVEADLTVIAKANSVAPAIIAMIITFFFVSALAPDARLREITSAVPLGSIQRTGEAFNNHFNAGLQEVSRSNYQAAKDAFLSALPYISVANWDARYASFYHNYCFTRIKLKESAGYIEFLENQLARDAFRADYRLQLVMMYSLEGRLSEARTQYQALKQREPKIAADVRYEMMQHGIVMEPQSP